MAALIITFTILPLILLRAQPQSLVGYDRFRRRDSVRGRPGHRYFGGAFWKRDFRTKQEKAPVVPLVYIDNRACANWAVKIMQTSAKFNDKVVRLGSRCAGGFPSNVEQLPLPVTDWAKNFQKLFWGGTNGGVELHCFTRFAALLQYMDSTGIDRVAQLDTDIAVFSNITDLNHVLFQDSDMVVSWVRLANPLPVSVLFGFSYGTNSQSDS